MEEEEEDPQSIQLGGAGAASDPGAGAVSPHSSADAAAALPERSVGGAAAGGGAASGSSTRAGIRGNSGAAGAKAATAAAADDGTPAPVQKFKMYNEQWLEQAEGIAEDFVSTPAMERLKTGSFGAQLHALVISVNTLAAGAGESVVTKNARTGRQLTLHHTAVSRRSGSEGTGDRWRRIGGHGRARGAEPLSAHTQFIQGKHLLEQQRGSRNSICSIDSTCRHG